MVLVDTSIWSLSLRRRAVDLSHEEMAWTQGQVQLLGSTRQEVLSGIREESQFLRIRDHLGDFPNVALDEHDHEEAASISNTCRHAGIAGSPVDMLLCSVSLRHGWEIFTSDLDFLQYQRAVPIRLLEPLA
jgi:predicted nucleic acid-binding protein